MRASCVTLLGDMSRDRCVAFFPTALLLLLNLVTSSYSKVTITTTIMDLIPIHLRLVSFVLVWYYDRMLKGCPFGGLCKVVRHGSIVTPTSSHAPDPTFMRRSFDATSGYHHQHHHHQQHRHRIPSLNRRESYPCLVSSHARDMKKKGGMCIFLWA